MLFGPWELKIKESSRVTWTCLLDQGTRSAANKVWRVCSCS